MSQSSHCSFNFKKGNQQTSRELMAADTDLDMSGEGAGEASTFARLASSLWMAEASEVGLAVEPV